MNGRLRNENGVAMIVELILVVAVVAVAGVALTKTYYKKSATIVQAVVTSKVVLSDKCSYNDPDLCRFLNNTGQYTGGIKATAVSAGKYPGETYFALDSHGNSQVTVVSNGIESLSAIVIGSDSYAKNLPSTAWVKRKLSADQKAQIDKDNTAFYYQSLAASSQPATTHYEKIDREVCDKLTCFKYKVTTTSKVGTALLWFDENQYKLRKIESVQNGTTTDISYSYVDVSVTAPL